MYQNGMRGGRLTPIPRWVRVDRAGGRLFYGVFLGCGWTPHRRGPGMTRDTIDLVGCVDDAVVKCMTTGS